MENNKKKNEKKKRKLRTLILLLFLTIIMFGTSTYAWFTANQTVTIQSINVHVETSDGIQISTNGSTWKSIITTADIIGNTDGTPNYYAAANNFIPNTLDAVSTDGTLITDSSAGTKKLDFYSSVIGTDATSGNYTIMTQQINEATDKTKFVAFDIFLKVSSAKDVYLNSASTFSNVVPQEGSAAGDKGLKNAARVAFVPIGEAAATDTVATITSAYNDSTTATLRIWEPNADTHSNAVVNSVSTAYNIPLTASGTASSGAATYNFLPYRGVTDVISTPQDLVGTVNGSVTTGTAAVTGTSSKSGNVYSSDGLLLSTPLDLDYANTNYQVFSLPAGITKMRIYMWIEGQDLDCENNASGTDITFNLEFTIPQATPTNP